MAAAASFMVLFGVAVLFWPERSKPDLVVVNALPLDSMLFAMRGGETNDIMDAGRAVSFVHEIAVKQSGRPVPVVVVTSGALTNKLSSALAGRASAGRGYFLVLTENSEVAGWIQLDIRDKTTGASKGKTQIRPISSVSETTDLIEQLLQKIMVSER
jgi:broad specificity phosphatase PhoE